MFGIMVILEHEYARGVGDDSKVHCFECRALVAGTVARKGDRDLSLAVDLGRQRGADRDRCAGTDDAIGTEHAFIDVGDVH